MRANTDFLELVGHRRRQRIDRFRGIDSEALVQRNVIWEYRKGQDFTQRGSSFHILLWFHRCIHVPRLLFFRFVAIEVVRQMGK